MYILYERSERDARVQFSGLLVFRDAFDISTRHRCAFDSCSSLDRDEKVDLGACGIPGNARYPEY